MAMQLLLSVSTNWHYQESLNCIQSLQAAFYHFQSYSRKNYFYRKLPVLIYLIFFYMSLSMSNLAVACRERQRGAAEKLREMKICEHLHQVIICPPVITCLTDVIPTTTTTSSPSPSFFFLLLHMGVLLCIPVTVSGLM